MISRSCALLVSPEPFFISNTHGRYTDLYGDSMRREACMFQDDCSLSGVLSVSPRTTIDGRALLGSGLIGLRGWASTPERKWWIDVPVFASELQ